MPLPFTLVLLLLPSTAIALYFKKRILETVPLLFFGTIFVGYFLSLFKLLQIAPFIYLALCIAGAGYIIFCVLKKKDLNLKENLFDIAIIAFVALLLWWLCRGRYYEIWDEISHWGKYLKGMYQNDTLYCFANPQHSFNEYSPSVSIFQYIMLKCMPFGFREDISMFVQSVVFSCLLMWVTTQFKKQNYTAKLLFIPIMLLLPITLFIKFYTYILADSGMGVIFGFLMLYYFLAKDDKVKYLTIFLGCFVLTLTKTAAIAFCIIIVLVALVNEFVCKKPVKKALRIPFFALFATLLARYSWQIFLNVYDIYIRWTPNDMSFEAILQLFNGTAPSYRLETIKLFFTNIFSDRVYGWILHFSFMEWFILLAVLAVLAVFMMEKPKRKGFIASFIAFLAGIFLYTISILVSYLFYFSQGEALALASISRYLNPVLLAAIVVLFGIFLYCLSYKKITFVLSGGAVSILLVFLLGSPSVLPFFKDFANAPKMAAQTANIHASYADIATQLVPLSSDNYIKVFFVSQMDTGIANLTFTYEMDPVKFPEHNSSIGEPYAEWDIWTQKYTAESFEKELYDNYDYLCLVSIDDAFLLQFKELFTEDADIQNGKILRVEKQEKDNVILLPIN